MGKDTSSSIKKKRKTNTEISDQEVDIYKVNIETIIFFIQFCSSETFQKVVEFEEKESRIRSSSVDAELFYRTCVSIKEMIIETYKQKGSNVSIHIHHSTMIENENLGGHLAMKLTLESLRC